LEKERLQLAMQSHCWGTHEAQRLCFAKRQRWIQRQSYLIIPHTASNKTTIVEF